MSVFPRLAIVVVLLISGYRLTGGAPPSDSSSGGAASSNGGSDPAISRVACDDDAFDLALLDQPGGAENADDAAAVALRQHLASGMETDFLPAAGSPESVTVIFTVVARPGGHTCPSNPATPFRLLLPEPLGDRVLLDGSSIPPRDATGCEPDRCP